MPRLRLHRIALRNLKQGGIWLARAEGVDLSLVGSITRIIARLQQDNLQIGRRPDLAHGHQGLVISLSTGGDRHSRSDPFRIDPGETLGWEIGPSYLRMKSAPSTRLTRLRTSARPTCPARPRSGTTMRSWELELRSRSRLAAPFRHGVGNRVHHAGPGKPLSRPSGWRSRHTTKGPPLRIPRFRDRAAVRDRLCRLPASRPRSLLPWPCTAPRSPLYPSRRRIRREIRSPAGPVPSIPCSLSTTPKQRSS